MSLCLLHFFSSRPLWLDEISILANIKDLPYLQLFGPLKNCQAFPRIYLALIKLFSSQMGFSLISLRFLPLACMSAAFFIWMKACKKEALVLFPFSVSYWIVYYAAELKPYSMDLAVAGIFLLSVSGRGRQRWLFLMPFLLFFSYAAVFFLWIPAYNLLMRCRNDKSALPALVIYTAFSALAAAGAYFTDLRYGLSQNCLFGYWKDYFLCVDSWYCFARSFTEGLRNMVAWPYGDSRLFLRLGSAFIPFFVLGLLLSFRVFLAEVKSGIRSAEALGVVLFMELFIFGLMKKYPFTGERITLFFVPFIFLIIARGIGALRKYKAAYLFFASAYCFFLAACGVNSLLKYLSLYF